MRRLAHALAAAEVTRPPAALLSNISTSSSTELEIQQYSSTYVFATSVADFLTNARVVLRGTNTAVIR